MSVQDVINDLTANPNLYTVEELRALITAQSTQLVNINGIVLYSGKINNIETQELAESYAMQHSYGVVGDTDAAMLANSQAFRTALLNAVGGDQVAFNNILFNKNVGDGTTGIWHEVSADFVSDNASGNVWAIVGPDANPNGVLALTELEATLDKPGVTSINNMPVEDFTGDLANKFNELKATGVGLISTLSAVETGTGVSGAEMLANDPNKGIWDDLITNGTISKSVLSKLGLLGDVIEFSILGADVGQLLFEANDAYAAGNDVLGDQKIDDAIQETTDFILEFVEGAIGALVVVGGVTIAAGSTPGLLVGAALAIAGSIVGVEVLDLRGVLDDLGLIDDSNQTLTFEINGVEYSTTINDFYYEGILVSGSTLFYDIFLETPNALAYNSTTITMDGGAGDDLIFANDQDNLISTGDGEDTVLAEGGNDTIIAGEDADTIDGGDGSDTISFATYTDGVAVNLTPGTGNDYGETVINNVTEDRLYNIENVIGGTGDDTIFGNAENNNLNGGGGNDTIYGGDENDALYGGAGNDRLYGDDGTDSLYFEGAFGHDTVSSGESLVIDGTTFLGNFEQLDANLYQFGSYTIDKLGTNHIKLASGTNSIEITDWNITSNYGITLVDDTSGGGENAPTIIGTSAPEYLYGDYRNDFIYGRAGDDTLYGFGGDDTLRGEGGSDSLIGGGGDDDLWENNGDDHIADWLQGNEGNDLVHDSSGNNTLEGGIGNDTVLGSGFVSGGAGDDQVDHTFYNNPEAFTTTLDGGDGNDSLGSPGGNVIMLGGAGHDFLASGNSGLFASSIVILDGGQGDDSIWLERGSETVYGGTGNDTIHDPFASSHPNSEADLIYGGDGNDVIIAWHDGNHTVYGDEGHDFIRGGAGNSILNGGGGIDTIYSGDGNESIIGGGGLDEIHFESDFGNDTVTSGDRIYIDSDRLLGDAVYDSVSGNTVLDDFALTVVAGGLLIDDQSGNSILLEDWHEIFNNYGITIAELFTGGSNPDSLLGSSGNDTMLGAQDHDTLDGGAGNDIIDGGSGTDTIIFNGTFGNDTVTGGEVIKINGDTLSGTTAYDSVSGGLVLAGFTLSNTTSGLLINDGTGNSILLQDWNETSTNYGISLSVLIGTESNDTINGSNYNDMIYALGGNDFLDGGNGIDTIIFNGAFGHDTVTAGEYIIINDVELGDMELSYDISDNTITLGDMVLTPTVGGVLLNDENGNSILLADWSNSKTYDIGLQIGTEAGETINLFSQNYPIILGFGGNDLLVGSETTNDTIDGGAGNDTIIPKGGTDTIIFNGTFGNDSVDEGEIIVIDGNVLSGEANFDPATGNWLLNGFAISETTSGLLIDDGAGNSILLQDWNEATTNYGITLPEIPGLITGGIGHDSLEGTTTNDFIYGYGGNDTLFGLGGNDLLDGGDDHDTLYGGAGDDTLNANGIYNDILDGGDGFDTYQIEPDLTTGSHANHEIIDSDGQGVITINGITMAGTASYQFANLSYDAWQLTVGDDLFTFHWNNPTTLYIDHESSDGSQHYGSLRIAGFTDGDLGLTLQAAPDTVISGTEDGELIRGGSGNDTIYGLGSNDYLDGRDGNDSLIGGDGNDVLYGKNGNDTLDGGADNDVLRPQDGLDTVLFNGAFGNDTVSEGEIIVINGAILSGEAAYDSVSGGRMLNGFAISATTGGLLIDDGAGNSILLQDWNEATTNYGITLPEIPGLITGSSGDDNLIGNDALNDTISGYEGNDVLSGLDGNDSLDGGEGDDTVYGEAGNDTLVSSDLNGYDYYYGGDGFDTYRMAQTPAGSSVGYDVIMDSDHQGEIYIDDTLISGNAAYNFDRNLWELILGGETFTFYFADIAETRLDINLYSSELGYNLVGLDVHNFINGDFGINLLSADTLVSGTAGNDNITTGYGNDTIIGLEGDDNLNGQQGDDIIYGGSGNDFLEGWTGADTLDGGLGVDHFNLGPTNDNSAPDMVIITPEAGILEEIRNFGEGDMVDLTAFVGLTFADLNIVDNGNSVTVTFPTGGGSQSLQFYYAFVFPTGYVPLTIAEADFIFHEPGQLLEGTLTGNYTESTLTSSNLGTYEIVDWDGDGQMDIVSQGGFSGSDLVWINGATMTSSTIAASASFGDFRIADWNGDGQMDILADNTVDGFGWYNAGNTGQFTLITPHHMGDYSIGDINGDGSLDIVSNGGTYHDGNPISGGVWYNASGTQTRLTYNDLGSFKLADLNANGLDEIVSNDGVYGDGVPIQGLVYYNAAGAITRLAYISDDNFLVGQFDGDAALELAVNEANYTNGNHIDGALVVNMNGTSARITYSDLGEYIAADTDGDGISELVSTQAVYQNNNPDDGIRIYEAAGTNTRISYDNAGKLHAIDWDGDGVLDIFAHGEDFGNGLTRFTANGANDSLVGAGGNDTIIGGGGNDTLTGNDGADSFVFGAGFGTDTVTDFAIGTDTLRFSGIAGIITAQDILNNVSYGSDATITLTGHGTITLTSITSGLTVDDIVVV